MISLGWVYCQSSPMACAMSCAQVIGPGDRKDVSMAAVFRGLPPCGEVEGEGYLPKIRRTVGAMPATPITAMTIDHSIAS